MFKKLVKYFFILILLTIPVLVIFKDEINIGDVYLAQDSFVSRALSFSSSKKFENLNFVVSNLKDKAYLFNIEGKLLHIWKDKNGNKDWHTGILLEDRHIAVVRRDRAVELLDYDSNPLFSLSGRFIHDIQQTDDKQAFYVLGQEEVAINHNDQQCFIMDNFIAKISITGELLDKVFLYNPMQRLINQELLDAACTVSHYNIQEKFIESVWKKRDILHANSFYELKKDYKSFANKGDILFSFKRINTIALLEKETWKLKWFTNTMTIQQHNPSVTKDGNILVFDNREGVKQEQSRIIEFNPLNLEILWKYGSKNRKFYNTWGGHAQRLENGNTIISFSQEGEAVEVTREGKIVWHFKLNQKNAKEYENFYRLERIPSYVF